MAVTDVRKILKFVGLDAVLQMKVTFKIQYHTRWGESLSLLADDRKYPMSWGEGDVWSVTLPGCSASLLADYGYLLVEDGIVRRTEWSRHSAVPPEGVGELVLEDSWLDCPVEGCPFPRKHQAALFDRPGFRGAGTAVPVFSLRTENDFGIGEFTDLVPLVDWAVKTGQCVIQLLPVNDTTRKGGWDDSYPYSPVSSFALHPLYLNLQELGVAADSEFKQTQAELNALPELDYPRVFEAKMRYLRKAFEAVGARDMSSPSYRRFYKANAYWLDEYASFCARRDGLEQEYYAWMQYHLDKQFSAVVSYARRRGVYLKGDLPIGVSRDSADAYWHPELFNLDTSAGAPPDFFSRDGQNWGFPTYNWEAMARDDYAWWKARLRKMAEYFDAFRIDHILGFFRIWEIPLGQNGRMGHFNPALPYSADEITRSGLPLDGLFVEDSVSRGFYHPLISPDTSGLEPGLRETFDRMHTDFFHHRHNSFWRRNAEKKLPELLGATGMLACGEDLGMVPDCVPEVMASQSILSLEMSMMEKGRPWPYLSVCATSSHDMDTLRMQYADSNDGRGPEDWECRRMLRDHLESDSMLAIFPIQDWLSLDDALRRKDFRQERINDPANSHHHWRYRVHVPIERLCTSTKLCTLTQGLIKDSNRFTTILK